jgi:subtilisin family serine protease
MNWAVGKGVKVLSMSLGVPGYHEQWRPVTQILRQRGVLPVFAIGNEGPGTSRSPGNYPEALSVGAMDRNRVVADFSSSQRFLRPDDPLVPDLVGPGVDVISAKPTNAGGGFQSMDGTSMATPHIAGLAALLFQAKPTATLEEVENAIYASCSGGPGLPPDRADRGFPNAPRAVENLLNPPPAAEAKKSVPPRSKKPTARKSARRGSASKKYVRG